MDLRSKVFDRLATPHADTRFADSYFVDQACVALGCRPHEVWEALWGLVADRLIYLDTERQSTDNWRWKLSADGARVAGRGAWEPRDPERYLRRLRKRAPDLDPAAMSYVTEALRAFNARCYLATSVMLGVAAEQVFGRLSVAFVEASGDQAAGLRKQIENPHTTYFKRFEEFRKRLEPQRKELPEGLADNLTMDAVADLLRITRNAAGHPTGQSVDEDTAYTHLQMAGRFLAKMTELAVYFEARSSVGAG